MKIGTVEPIAGEPGRYYVDSSTPGEYHIVDLTGKRPECDCTDYHTRCASNYKAAGYKEHGYDENHLKRTWCKHCQAAIGYRHTWERSEERAAEKVGRGAVFRYRDQLAAGVVTRCKVAEPVGEGKARIPNFTLEVVGRKGKKLVLDMVRDRVHTYPTVEEAYRIADEDKTSNEDIFTR